MFQNHPHLSLTGMHQVFPARLFGTQNFRLTLFRYFMFLRRNISHFLFPFSLSCLQNFECHLISHSNEQQFLWFCISPSSGTVGIQNLNYFILQQNIGSRDCVSSDKNKSEESSFLNVRSPQEINRAFFIHYIFDWVFIQIDSLFTLSEIEILATYAAIFFSSVLYLFSTGFFSMGFFLFIICGLPLFSTPPSLTCCLGSLLLSVPRTCDF